MWKILIRQQQSNKKKKKVPICRSVFWPAAQVTVRTRFTASRHGAAGMQTLLSVNVWGYFACGGCNGRFASGSRCSRLPASIMTTRDDVCDTGGEEGSCREQGCRSLITDRWHENTHTHTHKFSSQPGYVQVLLNVRATFIDHIKDEKLI